MSSTQQQPQQQQQQHQQSLDLIHFNSNNTSSDNMDVLNKPNSGIVQQMVMSETASASLIATAVAKLTTSSVTTIAPSSTVSVVNKSESVVSTETESPMLIDQKFDNITTSATTTTTTPAPSTKPIAAIDTTVSTVDPQINIQSSVNALPTDTEQVRDELFSFFDFFVGCTQKLNSY